MRGWRCGRVGRSEQLVHRVTLQVHTRAERGECAPRMVAARKYDPEELLGASAQIARRVRQRTGGKRGAYVGERRREALAAEIGCGPHREGEAVLRPVLERLVQCAHGTAKLS